jgi:long-chain acyl-CoA synthetase
MSLFSEFEQVARLQPDAPAVVTLDGPVSYSAVLDLAERIAGGLHRAGLAKGDRVAVHFGNRPELASVYYACARAGAVIVPVTYRMSAGEVRFLVEHSGSRFYLGDVSSFQPCAKVIDGLGGIEQAWVLDLPGSTSRARSWVGLLSDAVPAPCPVGPDDFVVIFYTSGTTGLPKGLVCSQASLAASLELMDACGCGRAGATYTMYDLINAWVILQLFACLRRGRPLALTATFTPQVVLRMMRAYPCGWIGGAPSAFRAMIEAVADCPQLAPDLTDTFCVAGGDAVPVELSHAFLRTFGAHLQSTYGQTETAGPATRQPALDAVDVPSIGWPLPGVDVKIDAEPGEAGELLMRTRSRPVGSWNGAGIDVLDPAGWIASGDVVSQRPDGCLLFLGRKKDLIKVDCYPVSPLEVEQAIAQHPDVAAAVTFGVPDEVTGERLVAIVEPEPGRQLDPAQLLRHLSGRIADWKHPSEIQVVDKLPLLPSGKVGRQQLADRYTATPPG